MGLGKLETSKPKKGVFSSCHLSQEAGGGLRAWLCSRPSSSSTDTLASSGLHILTQFLLQLPPFASRLLLPKSRSPGRQEAAGPGRAWDSKAAA